MKVTNVKIKKVDGDKFDRLRAYVDVTLDDCLVIHGLKLMQGEQGLFVAMPSRKIFCTGSRTRSSSLIMYDCCL